MLTFFRRLRTLLWTALSIIIIACAVLVGLGKLLMPYSAQFKPRLEAWISKEFERPVELESFTGEWRAFGPQLEVKGLRLAPTESGGKAAVIEQAVIEVKPFNVLLPNRPLYGFRIVGADFQIVHRADGRFEFSGFGIKRSEAGSGNAFEQLAKIGEVLLEDSSLSYDDEKFDIHLDLRAINGRLQASGNQLLAEIGFRLAHEDNTRVSGELEATGILDLDSTKHPTAARWQLSGQELMLGELREMLPPSQYFPRAGRFNTQVWGEWASGDAHRVRGVADLRGAQVVTDNLDRSVEHINTRFKLAFIDRDDWRLDLSDFVFEDAESDWTVSYLALGRKMPVGVGLWLAADSLPVATPAAIAVEAVEAAGKVWPRYIPAAGTGEVRDFEMILNENMKLGTAVGDIHNASVSNWDIWPDISNAGGRLEFGPGRHGSLVIHGTDVVVEWPRMFEAPLTVDLPLCEVKFSWGAQKGNYQVALPDCRVESPFVSARSKMRFRSNTGKPAVDVMVYADRLDASVMGPYWPRDLLKDKAVTWLQQSMLAGEVTSGKLQIHGDMDHWPFDNGEGRFEAITEVRNAEVAYFEGWPVARQVDGTARFVNTGMDIVGVIGETAGLSADEVRVNVVDFRKPVLNVAYRSSADLPGFLRFIQRTPIAETIGTDLDAFEFVGAAETSGSLRVPLGSAGQDLNLQGQLKLNDNAFRAGEFDFALSGIGGTVTYDQRGFSAEGLAAIYRELPATLALRAGGAGGEEESDPPASTFVAQLRGDFPAQEIIPQPLLESWSPLQRIAGVAAWEAEFAVPGSGESPQLTVTSDLQGIEIALPEPLAKPAEALWPLRLSVPLAESERELELVVADRLAARVALADGWTAPGAASIGLGAGPAPALEEGLFSLSGSAGVFDLDGWIGLVIDQARQGKSLGGLQLEPGTLTASELRMVDRSFADVAMTLSSSQDSLYAGFEAESISGQLTFVGASGDNQSLSAEFERLVLDQPLTSGFDMNVEPSSLPALHLYARSFRYSGIELGETRIEAYPTAEAFHFEKVEAESEHISVRASGDWLLDEGAHRSNFDIHMTSESLGDFLRHLDIASPMEGGQTLVDFSVWWDGSPGQFQLARLNGDVNFSVHTGVINNANPGSGRLLGLLSVQSLPKRLALDFRDVFDSGFAFDEAKGSFTMANGSASTDDVVLKSSAANISLSGTTNLVDREYDQLITVRPGLGNTLPVIGAIAGGPTGAAAGLALQGLLHNELGEASQVQYTLTGAWDEPEIEPVLKEKADG